jgi:hypothetical protein
MPKQNYWQRARPRGVLLRKSPSVIAKTLSSLCAFVGSQRVLLGRRVVAASCVPQTRAGLATTSAQSQIEGVKECIEAGDPQAWRLAQSSITPDFLVGMDEITELVGYRHVENWNRVY